MTLLAAAGGVGLLAASRRRHDRAVESSRTQIGVAGRGGVFRRELVSGLPAVARTFFENAIAEGAEIPGSVCLTMKGMIGPRSGAKKIPFTAEQVISTRGLVWSARVGTGPGCIVGDDLYVDQRGAMAWYLGGLIPVVRASGVDVSRSAAGRVAIELPVMLPSALLPSEGARWEQIDAETARVILRVDDEEFQPVLSLDRDGLIRSVEMPRWDPDCGDGVPGLVLWRGELEGHRTFDGMTIPTRLSVTKRWGSPDADRFFEATLVTVRFR